MNRIPVLAIVLVAIGLGSLAVGLVYTAYNARPGSDLGWGTQTRQGMMGQWYQQQQTQTAPITIEQAKATAQQYLSRLGNPNLAVKEIMEFQNNFYIIYYEKDTGVGAFEMLVWKQAPSYGMMAGGMMGWRVTPGTIMPEPGPNMMWNTKYSPMTSGLMGYRDQPSSTMTVAQKQAEGFAQSYLDANYQGAKTEMATQFYGYFTFDFTVNGKVAGMLSVNGYTGQVWYHSWHGDFIREVQFN